jgi:hypothetical protein
LSACTKLIDLLLKRAPIEDQANLHLRRMFCSWLSACGNIVIARSEDSVEVSHQSYLAVRECGGAFRHRLPDQLKESSLTEPAQEDLKEKHFQLVKFELEAALKLLQWDEMEELFDVRIPIPMMDNALTGVHRNAGSMIVPSSGKHWRISYSSYTPAW